MPFILMNGCQHGSSRRPTVKKTLSLNQAVLKRSSAEHVAHTGTYDRKMIRYKAGAKDPLFIRNEFLDPLSVSQFHRFGIQRSRRTQTAERCEAHDARQNFTSVRFSATF